jgi:hypothetical protein
VRHRRGCLKIREFRAPKPLGDVIMESAVGMLAERRVGEWNGNSCTCVPVA